MTLDVVTSGSVSAVDPDTRRAGAVVVEVDGVPFGAVGRDRAAELGLAPGVVLDSSAREALAQAADAEAALRTALRALARRPFARKQLGLKLRQRGHPGPAVENALEQAAAMGLLDDVSFAEQYCQVKRGRGLGPARILRDLYRLGVADDTARQAVEAAFPDPEDTERQMRELAAKRAGQLGQLPAPVKRRRMLAYLARRGYRGSAAIEAVERLVGPGR